MKAGRELDALVGKTFFGVGYDGLGAWSNFHDGTFDKPWPESVPDFLCYSTDIAAAWQVVEHFKDAEWGLEKRAADPNVFWLLTADRQFHSGRGATAPLAICLAALAAVGVTDEPPRRAATA